MVRCYCITQKGKRCKRVSSQGGVFCFAHQGCVNPVPEMILGTVMLHQTKRFVELKYILKRSLDTKVIIPGTKRTHALGTGIARSAWAPGDYKKMHTHLNGLVKRLVTEFPDRVLFGTIGTTSEYPISKKYIHVWGANAGNWNLPNGTKILGGGQASTIGVQKPGVFGISTMPDDIDNVQTLLLPSNTIHV